MDKLAEEILDQYLHDFDWPYWSKENAVKAMQEYANQFHEAKLKEEGETTYPVPTWEEKSDKKTIDVLKSVNKYFIDLQNKCILTPHDENVWKKVSKILNNK